MPLLADILVGIVAFIHALILGAEMFLWRNPTFHTRLGFDQTQADKAAPIVANAGLFNGFLAAGLVWGLFWAGDALAVKTFFLSCVIVAGVFGAVTLNWKTLVLQSLPAAAALAAAWAARPVG